MRKELEPDLHERINVRSDRVHCVKLDLALFQKVLLLLYKFFSPLI